MEPSVLVNAEEEAQVAAHRSRFSGVHPQIEAEEICETLAQSFEAAPVVLDVRSEAEFERDHLPGSVNFPILNNQERHEVGYLYKQVAPSQAYAKAFAYGEAKRSQLIAYAQEHVREKKAGSLVVTCWRGGMRSASVVEVLRAEMKEPLPVFQLRGGTKAYRQQVQNDLATLSFYPPFLVLSGNTGSGKSWLLEKLEAQAVPVLHIERCARHMSSIFGDLPYQSRGGPVSQRQFENHLHFDLKRARVRMQHSGARAVMTEAESRRVGSVMMPELLDNLLHTAPTLRLEGEISFRCRLLKQDYIVSEEDCVPILKARLQRIAKRLGPKNYTELLQLLNEKNLDAFSQSILLHYYDKIYKHFPVPPYSTVTHSSFEELWTKGWEALQPWIAAPPP